MGSVLVGWGRDGTSCTLGYYVIGGLAQLARASALQAEGQRFESVILHDSGDWKDGRSERSERSQSL